MVNSVLCRRWFEQDANAVHFGTQNPDEGWSPLWEASFWKRKETVEYLLANGADINARTRNRESPLHGAVLGKDQSIVELLLSKDAEVNAQAENGMTALHRAVWQRSTAIVALLLEHDADKSIQDTNGITPLQLATAKAGESVAGWGTAEAPNNHIVQQLQ